MEPRTVKYLLGNFVSNLKFKDLFQEKLISFLVLKGCATQWENFHQTRFSIWINSKLKGFKSFQCFPLCI